MDVRTETIESGKETENPPNDSNAIQMPNMKYYYWIGCSNARFIRSKSQPKWNYQSTQSISMGHIKGIRETGDWRYRPNFILWLLIEYNELHLIAFHAKFNCLILEFTLQLNSFDAISLHHRKFILFTFNALINFANKVNC